MRSAPKIGTPWPQSSSSAPHPAISRSAVAQSLAKRCTFCGLPAFGTAQMNRSPGCSTPSSGTNVHVASSVSPRAWCSSNVSSPCVNVTASLYVTSGSRYSAGHSDPSIGRANWRWLMAVFQPCVRS